MKTAVAAIIVSLILESFITTLPLTICVILFLAITQRRNEIFLLAFVSGLILDILTFGRIGISSLLFVTIVQVVFSYEGKFELETLPFIFFATLLSSFVYLFATGREIIFQTILVSLFSAISFTVFLTRNKKIPSYV